MEKREIRVKSHPKRSGSNKISLFHEVIKSLIQLGGFLFLKPDAFSVGESEAPELDDSGKED